jgi:cell division inhibitor SulA
VVRDGPDEPLTTAQAAPSITIEQALTLLRAGKTRVVVNALPDLKRQLAPLLQLIEQTPAGQETA